MILYYRPGCGFSQRVLDEVSKLDAKIELRSIYVTQFADELMDLGGKMQVPFLFDEDTETKMYDSAKINAYLRKHTPHHS